MMHVADYGMTTKVETEEYAWGFKTFEDDEGETFYIFEAQFPSDDPKVPYYFREKSRNPERVVGVLVRLMSEKEYRDALIQNLQEGVSA
jgi:hypothetical protein